VFVYETVYSESIHRSIVETVTEYSALPSESEVTIATIITYWSPSEDRYVSTTVTYETLLPTTVHLDYSLITVSYTVTYYSPRAHNFLTTTETYLETVAYYAH